MSEGRAGETSEMCPHCGDLFALFEGLIAPHGYEGLPCPGSQQIARCAESDARPLWNGEPNRFFRG